jgi:hypothetical protein
VTARPSPETQLFFETPVHCQDIGAISSPALLGDSPALLGSSPALLGSYSAREPFDTVLCGLMNSPLVQAPPIATAPFAPFPNVHHPFTLELHVSRVLGSNNRTNLGHRRAL